MNDYLTSISMTYSGFGLDDTPINNPASGMPGPSIREMVIKENPYRNYSVRIFKGDLSNLEDVMMIEEILTKAVATETGNIVLVEKATASFQDSYFVILTYLEKNTNA